jgi:hypothetical protein
VFGKGIHAATRSRLYRIICSSGIQHKHQVVIGIFLYLQNNHPKLNWVLETLDVEASFLNAVPAFPSYIEWPRGILEFDFLNKEETSTCTVSSFLSKHRIYKTLYVENSVDISTKEVY